MAASRVPLQLVRFASSTTTVKYLFARPSSSTTCVRLPAPKSASTTTFAMYIYTKTGPTSTARTFAPLPTPCTTTSHDDRCENVYFHLHRIKLEPPRNARFKGITAENDRHGTNACVLYEMPAFAPCPKLSRACFTSLPCHHLVGTRFPGSPHLLSHVTLSSLFLLHRYLHELSEPECCRGIIFVIFVVAPFSFRHGDQMLHNMLMSTFS